MEKKFYLLYLSLRYNWLAFRSAPVPLIGTEEENLIFANMVMQGTLYGRERFYREFTKRKQTQA